MSEKRRNLIGETQDSVLSAVFSVVSGIGLLTLLLGAYSVKTAKDQVLSRTP